MSLWITNTLCAALLIGCCLSDLDPASSVKSVLPSATNNTLYSIVFDAGSTGTRLHVYFFRPSTKGPLLELDGEIFESVKPGLSAYADQPEEGAASVSRLLHLAQDAIPPEHWNRTPLILRATAGLRLLPGPRADHLLSEVRKVFLSSPFLIPPESVSILDGREEGILAWIAVNFLIGRLHGERSVGILDLGGASTQITFLPLAKDTLNKTPADFLATFELFSSTYRLYTHSYLGLGLKSARLSVLRVSEESAQQEQIFRSHCFPPTLETTWTVTGVTYRYAGHMDGLSGFDLCYSEVLPVVERRLHQLAEFQERQFYAFSYYYDRAVDTSLIDFEGGGELEVRDFAQKAREVCDHMTSSDQSSSPFLCMDLVYITALLREGFGFQDETVLQLTKKVHGVEMSWTLGAAFHVLQTTMTPAGETDNDSPDFLDPVTPMARL